MRLRGSADPVGRADRRRARGGWGELGAISAEYVGVVVLVAAVIAGLITLALPDRVADEGEQAVCSLFSTDGSCRADDGPGGPDDPGAPGDPGGPGDPGAPGDPGGDRPEGPGPSGPSGPEGAGPDGAGPDGVADPDATGGPGDPDLQTDLGGGPGDSELQGGVGDSDAPGGLDGLAGPVDAAPGDGAPGGSGAPVEDGDPTGAGSSDVDGPGDVGEPDAPGPASGGEDPGGSGTPSADEPEADAAVVAAALDDLDDLLDDDISRGEPGRVRDLLAGLDDAELDAVIASLTPEQLAVLDRILGGEGGNWFFGDTGLSDDDARALLNDLLSRVSADQVAHLGEHLGAMSPSYADVPSVKKNDERPSRADELEFARIEGADLFVDGPNWDDIDQGSLGDCHLLASLGAIAAIDPGAIEDMIVDHGNGTYTVTFYDGDEAVEVTVDDRFPLDVDTGSAEFAQPGRPPELWPLLVEKAYAQLAGEYVDIHFANTAETLADVTGRETTRRDPSDVTASDLAARHAAGEPLVLSSFPSDDTDDKTTYNGTWTDAAGNEVPPLFGSHAYFITEVDESAGTVTIRNPHGPRTPDIVLDVDDLDDYFNRVVTYDD